MVRFKFWIITIEGILLLIAVVGLVVAYQIWQQTSETTTQEISGSNWVCPESLGLGTSANGLEIQACQSKGSSPNAENTLLVIGTIHGDEPDGKRVVDELRVTGASVDTNIWLLRDGNPDGSILGTRKNANEVDLNRNFPIKWMASEPSARTYSGPSPASESETLALMNAVELIRPTHIVVFHQPFEQIDCPPERPKTVSDRLSQLTGYKSECIPGEKSGSPTNSYTGTFTIWVNSTFPETTAVTFELGVETSQLQIETIAKALQVLAADESN